MKALVRKLKHFLRQCGGPTAVEYAVLLVLIIFGAMTAVSLLGSALDTSVRSTAGVMPSGQADQGSSGSDQGNNGKNDKKEKKQKRPKKSRKGRGRRRRSASSFSAMSSSLARCV